jgi:hypothetical protein
VFETLIEPSFFTMNAKKDPNKFTRDCLAWIKMYGRLDLALKGETTAERAENFFRPYRQNWLVMLVKG